LVDRKTVPFNYLLDLSDQDLLGIESLHTVEHQRDSQVSVVIWCAWGRSVLARPSHREATTVKVGYIPFDPSGANMTQAVGGLILAYDSLRQSSSWHCKTEHECQHGDIHH
jgi:hypothetical protein